MVIEGNLGDDLVEGYNYVKNALENWDVTTGFDTAGQLAIFYIESHQDSNSEFDRGCVLACKEFMEGV